MVWTTEPGAAEAGPAERTEKISEIIARQIVRDIARNGIPSGTMLPPEAAMLARFKVGRASLREALRLLEVYGLITIKPGPGGGPIVQDVTSKQFARTATFYFHLHGATFRHLLDARRTLEPLMARQAARSGDVGAIAELIANVAAARAAIEGDDEETWRLLTGQFHAKLAGASGNHILDLFGQSIRDLYTERLEVRALEEPAWEAVQAEHEAIVDAIVEHREEDAARLMTVHMKTFTDVTVERLRGRVDDILDWR